MSPTRRGVPRVLINPPSSALGSANAILSGDHSKHVHSFTGPLSIKWMPRGWAIWETAAAQYRVDANCYLVLNHGQVYSLTREASEPQASFCPFFAAGFVEDVHRALVTRAAELLDGPAANPAATIQFYEHLQPTDAWVVPQLQRMRVACGRRCASDAWLEEEFHTLAERLLLAQEQIRRQMAALPAARAATRAELFRRLQRARDYMHAHFADPLSLPTIARVGCLSAHHFHRLFREAFRQTPHQYLVGLRMARARALLRHTDRPVTEICFAVGFESLGSFSTRFRREIGQSPAQFRAQLHQN